MSLLKQVVCSECKATTKDYGLWTRPEARVWYCPTCSVPRFRTQVAMLQDSLRSEAAKAEDLFQENLRLQRKWAELETAVRKFILTCDNQVEYGRLAFNARKKVMSLLDGQNQKDETP